MAGRIDDHLRTMLALARFERMRAGETPTSYQELSARFGVSPKTIQLAIQEAFQRGLVKLTAAVQPPPFEFESLLQEKLMNRYPSLRHAIVITSPRSADYHPPYRALGYALASKIHEWAFLFRTGDIIGVGSGYFVNQVVEALTNFPPLATGEITIMSLTGSLFTLTGIRTQEIDEERDRLADADINCTFLTRSFGGLVSYRPISYPIAHSLHSRQEIVARTSLSDDQYMRNCPTHALIAVAALGRNSALFRAVAYSNQHAGYSPVGPILEPVRKLMDICDLISIKYQNYVPVGELASKLLFVPPSQCQRIDSIDKDLLEDVKSCIAEINGSLLTVSLRQLKQIPNIMLGAATLEEAPVLKAVLDEELVSVGILSITRQVAEFIING
jgi:hypothetical protein